MQGKQVNGTHWEVSVLAQRPAPWSSSAHISPHYPPFKLVLQQAYNHRADVVAKYHKVSACEATPRMASHEETFETLFSERDTGILCHVFKLAAYLDSAGAP